MTPKISISNPPTVGQTAIAAPNSSAVIDKSPGPAPGQRSADSPPVCQRQTGAADTSGTPPASFPEAAPAATVYGRADPAQLSNLPDVIKQHAFCCVWRAVPRPGSPKPAKVPYDPKTGKSAKPGDMSTFGSFDEALAALSTGSYNGIGIAVIGTVVAVDIDGCVDAEGSLSPMAKDIIGMLDGYTEYSPSGAGIRIFVLVSEGYTVAKDRYYINNQELHLEIYIAGITTKYVTVTGNTLTPGMGLVERSNELTAVLDKYMVRPQSLASTPAATQTADPAATQTADPAATQTAGPAATQTADPAATQAADQQLLNQIMQAPNGARLAALLKGDMSTCGNDHSSADMTACNILAAYTSDPAQIDRIIRSSALMRDKWDRKQSGSTYGAITINKAISSAVQYRQDHGELTPEQIKSVFVKASPQQTLPGQQTSQAPAQAAAPAVPAVPIPKPKCISAKELSTLQIPPTMYLVNKILPEGTTIFTGPSKARKSFEVLALGLDIAAGVPHMGLDTAICGVLYLSLEDSWGRIQERMMGILAGRPVPENFYFWTEAPSLDTCLLAILDEHLKQHPETKLVIIDTFQRIRGAAKRGESSYATDYREMGLLKNWALSRGVSILLVHHNRKMPDSDAFNMISGTNGIMGSADTIWVITKEKRMDDAATLHITGRDVLPQELTIQFDNNTLRWDCLGSADAVQAQQEKADYDSDELVLTIKDLLNSNNGKWSGYAKEIIDAGKQNNRLDDYKSQTVGKRINALSDKLLQYGNIKYHFTKVNGTGGRKHHFTDLSACPPSAGPTDDCDPDEDTGDGE